ncbi:MAG: hypothetical protein ACXVIG_04470 [Halobacteriota archaeon]
MRDILAFPSSLAIVSVCYHENGEKIQVRGVRCIQHAASTPQGDDNKFRGRAAVAAEGDVFAFRNRFPQSD